jgi:hypothetical protein
VAAKHISLENVRAWIRRRRRAEHDERDRLEVDRLNAEYTGSFARNFGQEAGILPPRHRRS